MSGSMQTSPWIVIVWYDVSWSAIYSGGNRGSERLQDDSPGSSRGGVEPVGLWRPVSAGHLACPTVSVCDLRLTCPFAWSTLFYLLKFSSPFKSQHQRQQHDICPRCRASVMAGFYLSLSGRTSRLPGWCYLPPLGSCSLAGTAVCVHIRVPRRHARRIRSAAALTSFLSHPRGWHGVCCLSDPGILRRIQWAHSDAGLATQVCGWFLTL